MAKTQKTDVYQMVVDRIVSEMEKGIIPWQKPWNGAGGCISYSTGKSYSPLNCFLLGEPGEYITCKQCNELGGTVKKGAKSRIVVFNKKITYTEKVVTEEGEEVEEQHQYFAMRYYNVFHINDCEGIEPKWTVNTPKNEITTDEVSEKVVTDYEAREPHLKITRTEESNQAYFSPSRDCIVVPMLSQYEDQAEYYSTLYHEMVHSTGVKTRCDRGLESCAAFGSESYNIDFPKKNVTRNYFSNCLNM